MKIFLAILTILSAGSVCASEPIKCEHIQGEFLDALQELRSALNATESTEEISANLEAITLLGKYEVSLSPAFEQDLRKVIITTSCEISSSYCKQVFLVCSLPLLSGKGSCNNDIIKCVE